MKKFYAIPAIAALMCLGAATAHAEIIWNQSGASSNTGINTNTNMNSGMNAGGSVDMNAPSTFGNNYNGTGDKTPHPAHQNLQFDGNTSLTKADTMKLQRALAKRGLYHGKIDGLWGGQTTQAILDYQSVHEQALTGTMNAGTLDDLGVHINPMKYTR